MRNTSSHISDLYLIRFAFHNNESSSVSRSKQLCYSLNGIKYSVIDIGTMLPPLVSCFLVTMVTSDCGAGSRRCDRILKRKREGMKEEKEVTEG